MITGLRFFWNVPNEGVKESMSASLQKGMVVFSDNGNPFAMDVQRNGIKLTRGDVILAKEIMADNGIVGEVAEKVYFPNDGVLFLVAIMTMLRNPYGYVIPIKG